MRYAPILSRLRERLLVGGAFCCALLGSSIGARPAQCDTRWVVTQSTPSDCGPAALATLLRYYCDVETSEAEMVRLTGATALIGTTFLKLQQATEAKGGTADSFRMTLPTLQEQLKAYPMPVIVRTLGPEPHFSVLLGWDGDRVLLADPAHGNIMLSQSAFLKRWYIPGTKEGFVFIATGPNDHVNQQRHAEIVGRLKQQHRTLQTVRLPMLRTGR
jgi:predicted double-glycine peptidase